MVGFFIRKWPWTSHRGDSLAGKASLVHLEQQNTLQVTSCLREKYTSETAQFLSPKKTLVPCFEIAKSK